MKTKILKILLVGIITNLSAQEKRETIGSVERINPEMDLYVPKGSEVEILARGFGWSEGPVWVDQLNAVLFSDVRNNKAYRWDDKNGLSVFLDPSGFTGIVPANKKAGSNGLTLNSKNELVLAMHGDRRIAKLKSWNEKTFETIVNRYEGNLFSSPNDLVYAKNGDLYFTDPPYGLKDFNNDGLKELPYNGVYKLSYSGSLSLIINDLSIPNGIAISNDQKTLYVNVSDREDMKIMAYDVTSSGVTNGRVFFDGNELAKKDNGSFDGLKIHPSGTIFSTGPGGVLVIKPDGTHLGTIRTEKSSANCAFDSSFQNLYMTSHMYLTRIKL
ncbi:MAG: SMP-30/gluconolactonase/LRE family protein [Flavobacteriaceae bacterium TMED121]|nr:MAG: SMP-30/gluconolactonase/LRE family protein [Flavobacteriaceae bacterium TMED121]|tara:strand:- start:840 stop:1823 length:984 start_codon:yes stop_codon:yes gene_type:complete